MNRLELDLLYAMSGTYPTERVPVSAQDDDTGGCGACEQEGDTCS